MIIRRQCKTFWRTFYLSSHNYEASKWRIAKCGQDLNVHPGIPMYRGPQLLRYTLGSDLTGLERVWVWASTGGRHWWIMWLLTSIPQRHATVLFHHTEHAPGGHCGAACGWLLRTCHPRPRRSFDGSGSPPSIIHRIVFFAFWLIDVITFLLKLHINVYVNVMQKLN